MALERAAGNAIVSNSTSVLKAGGVDLPEGVQVTTIDAVVNWCRKYSLWPMPFATACCGIELMAVGSSRFDIARFGAEVMRFSPRQCDLMIVAGRVTMKMLPVLQRIWLQMPEPKWCISMGACACSGGVFDTYAVVQGVDRFIPVDVYIPGCPPRPEQILRSLMDMQDKIQRGGRMFGSGLPEIYEKDRLYLEKKALPAGTSLAGGQADEGRFGSRGPGGGAVGGAAEPGCVPPRPRGGAARWAARDGLPRIPARPFRRPGPPPGPTRRDP